PVAWKPGLHFTTPAPAATGRLAGNGSFESSGNPFRDTRKRGQRVAACDGDGDFKMDMAASYFSIPAEPHALLPYARPRPASGIPHRHADGSRVLPRLPVRGKQDIHGRQRETRNAPAFPCQ